MPNAKFFIDPTLASAAGPYYTLFPVEPTPSAASADWLKPDGKLAFPKSQNLDEWLTAIAGGASAGGNVVLVSHGNKLGLKLYIGEREAGRPSGARGRRRHPPQPVGQRDRRQHGADPEDEARCLGQAEGADRKSAGPGSQPGRCARLQHRPGRQFDERNAAVLQLQHLLLAQDSRQLRRHQLRQVRHRPRHLRQMGEGPSGRRRLGRCGSRWRTCQTPSKGVTLEAIAAKSAKGVKAWANSKMPAGGSFTGNNQLFYHALTDLKTFVFAGEARDPRPAGRGHQGQRAVAQDRHQRAPDAAVRTAGVELPSSRPSPQGERETSVHDRPLIVEEGLSAPRGVSPIFEGRSGRDDGNCHMPDSSFSATALDASLSQRNAGMMCLAKARSGASPRPAT